MTSADTEQPPFEQIGRYKIVTPLADGGMAQVALARCEGMGGFERLVAVKTIHRHLTQERRFISMFLDEARIAARIHHPNVVSVYEIGEEDGRHFIAMDYVSGESLAMVFSRCFAAKRAFPIDILLHLLSSACEGLHAAHELRDADDRPLDVVHRDVSPQNLLIGYDGTLRVTDFGVAKAADQLAHTKPGSHKGKTGYMAPEQVRGEKLDRRVDVFALGILLWEGLVGKRLFKFKNDFNTARRVLRLEVPPPSTFRQESPGALDAIVLKALAKDPEERHQTARELGQALRQLMASELMNVGSDDVERFMRTLCEERYEEKRALERAAASTQAEGLKEEIDSRFVALTKMTLTEEPEAFDDGERDEPTGAARAAARSRWRTPVAFGFGFAIALGVLALNESRLSAPPVAADRPAPVDANIAPRPPSEITLHFDVTPRRAIIEVDGVRVEDGAILERKEGVRELRIRAEGFLDKAMQIDASQSQTISVILEQISKAAPPPPRAAKRKPRRSKRVKARKQRTAPQKKRADEPMLTSDDL